MWVIFFILFSTLSFSISQQEAWIDYSSSEKLNIKHLIDKIKLSSTGRKLLADAYKKNHHFLDHIFVGQTSLTDTTLYRHYNPDDRHGVKYESESKIFLDRSLSSFDALFDLVHELTHYVYREPFNPYLGELNPIVFVRETIEDRGGEAHALAVECQVLLDLYPEAYKQRNSCRAAIVNGVVSLESIKKKFYYVHPDNSQAIKQILGDKIQSRTPAFISSAYNTSYPVAALKEFQKIKKSVCDNDLKRLGRSIASTDKQFVERCLN